MFVHTRYLYLYLIFAIFITDVDFVTSFPASQYFVQVPEASTKLANEGIRTQEESGWENRAAQFLNKDGMVCLVTGEDKEDGIISHKICETVSKEIDERLLVLKEKIESRGVDSQGVEAPFRFMELVSRDEGGRRYDIPVPWKGQGDAIGTELSPSSKHAIHKLHSSIDSIVSNIVNKIWSGSNFGVITAGFLVNDPGSSSQQFHRDGPDEGFLDVFVPISGDLEKELGPTACIPKSHLDNTDASSKSSSVLEPLLKKGECLIFDYRLLHRGQKNFSKSTRRTLAYVVYRKDANLSEKGDLRNYPSALTLEFD